MGGHTPLGAGARLLVAMTPARQMADLAHLGRYRVVRDADGWPMIVARPPPPQVGVERPRLVVVDETRARAALGPSLSLRALASYSGYSVG